MDPALDADGLPAEAPLTGPDPSFDYAPAAAEPAHPVAAAPAESTTQVIAVPSEPAKRNYPSLYDSTGTTIVAVVLGIIIVGGIQWFVQRIYTKARSEHEILTRFVVTIVALVVGAYITDLLIAGPDTSLLSTDEHTIILGFIKDICLMVFAFYFGTKAGGSPPSTPTEP